jgi:hypothetical protein
MGGCDLSLATTALHLEVYKAELDKLKIPRSVAEKSFAAMEKFGAATLNDPLPAGVEDALRRKREAEFKRLKEQLAQDLNAYANSAKTRRGLPLFVVIGGCGAVEMEAAINTTPPGGTVTYIPLFRYKLCEATHVDPSDSQNCDGWVTAVSVKCTRKTLSILTMRVSNKIEMKCSRWSCKHSSQRLAKGTIHLSNLSATVASGGK